MTEEYHRSMVFSIHRFIMRLRFFFAALSAMYVAIDPILIPPYALIIHQNITTVNNNML